ncbi:MAG: HAD family hydrolase [Lachnospiraceae bacterium]|nr:HAD family hydrolase [Lachnospiraceae bacterium]
MSYNTVIFDLDGTLLDTLDDLSDSVNYALSKMNYPLRKKGEIRLFLGNGIKNLMKLSVPDGIPDEDFDKTFNYFKEYYNVHNQDKTKPYDGVITLMHDLKNKGIKMAIVSNKVQSAVDQLREKFFSDVIDIAIGDSPDIKRKPEPDSCFKALKLLNSSIEESVYVGDSEVDMATANNAGLDLITCLWGFRDRDFLIEKGAKVFAETPADIEREVLKK